MLGSARATFPRTLRRGSKGEDVRQLQDLLRRAGFDPGATDGDFGPNTEVAVRGFQRAHNLVPDGIAGPLTIAALTADVIAPPVTGSPSAAPSALSLHIGLNNVDPAAYPFPVPVLAGCINDCNDMRDLAAGMGFRTRQLIDAAATSGAVLAAIDAAAKTLRAGDIFLLTYSGHGSQVPDTMAEETDQLDETWVLYDRQLLDDELYDLWCRFAPGVRILMISDSCHSGTVSRAVDMATAQVAAAYASTPESRGLTGQAANGNGTVLTRLSALQAVDVAFILDDVVGPPARGAFGATTRTDDATRAAIRRALGTLVEDQPVGTRGLGSDRPRRLAPNLALQDLMSRPETYRTAKLAALRGGIPTCSVMLFSGCQDNQTSSDGAPSAHQNGAFTLALLTTWRGARDYADMHRRILAQMPPTQTPNLYWATPRDAAFEAQSPFVV